MANAVWSRHQCEWVGKNGKRCEKQADKYGKVGGHTRGSDTQIGGIYVCATHRKAAAKKGMY